MRLRAPVAPVMTEEERAAALEKARANRAERARIRRALSAGELKVSDVLEMESEAVDRMRVSYLLESLHGTGKARSARVMEELGIARTRRVCGLREQQRKALIERFG